MSETVQDRTKVTIND